MNNTHVILGASYDELREVRSGSLSGVNVRHQREKGGSVETLWVDTSWTFKNLPAGISAEIQYTGENLGRGVKVLVTQKNSGTVTFFDNRVVR